MTNYKIIKLKLDNKINRKNKRNLSKVKKGYLLNWA
jgi:hypothetical protein